MSIRTQNETPAQRRAESKKHATDFTDAKDVARQEFKDDADINLILKKFGVSGQRPGVRPLSFGEVDYDLDLQRAFAAIRAAETAHAQLPPGLKDRYPDWRSLLNAAEDGSLESLQDPQPTPKPPQPETPPA